MGGELAPRAASGGPSDSRVVTPFRLPTPAWNKFPTGLGGGVRRPSDLFLKFSFSKTETCRLTTQRLDVAGLGRSVPGQRAGNTRSGDHLVRSGVEK